MFKTHPEFAAPNNPNISIWRYMDLPKFISLIDENALYFTRSDKFGDPFEGSIPKETIRLRQETMKIAGMDEAHRREWLDSSRWRQYVAVNCWHMNDHESAAMWNQYGASGVAIQSTYERLSNAIVDPRSVFLGTVTYLDYMTDAFTEGNLFKPFLHKRKSFEHERELRACVWSSPLVDGKPDWSIAPMEHGCHVSVDAKRLVERVFVAPSAPPWFTRIVKSTVQKFGFDFPVLQSRMDDDPVF